MVKKICSECEQNLPSSAFYKKQDGSGDLIQRCKECRKAAGQRRRRKPENKIRARENNCLWPRGRFEEQWEKQKGRCDCCDRKMVRTGRRVDSSTLDHCHDTGKPRGILCRRCNILEGVIDTHAEMIIAYWKKWA